MNILYILFIGPIIFMNPSQSINLDLVFSLQDYFNSDLILIAADYNSENFVKKFYKSKRDRIRGFIGVIYLNNENLKEVAEKNLKSQYQNTIIVTDKKNKLVQDLARIRNDTLKFLIMSSVIWVNFIEENMAESLEELYIPFSSRFFTITKINDSSYAINDVYQISENSSKIFSRFAVWEKGELQKIDGDFHSRRMDLEGYKMNIYNSHLVTFREEYRKLWDLFSEKMNFSLNLLTSAHPGFFYSNGTKTGSFQLIYERLLDGTPSNFVYTQRRLDFFDYIFPTMIAETKMYLKVDSNLNWSSYIAPFAISVWLSIFLIVILSSFVLFIIIRYSHKTNQSYGDAIFDVISALCCQAEDSNNSRISLRISHLIIYILAMILTEYYCGALSSYLSVRNIILPFKNLKGAVKDGSYKIAVVNGTYPLFFFNTDPGDEAEAIRENNLLLDPNFLPNDLVSGYHQLCNNRLIFLGLSFDIEIREKCDVIEVDDVIFNDSFGIIVWKGFPYKDILIKLMKRIQFAGLVKLKPKNKIMPYEDSGQFKPFSIQLVFPIFLFYLFACFLSLLILISEFKLRKISLFANNLKHYVFKWKLRN